MTYIFSQHDASNPAAVTQKARPKVVPVISAAPPIAQEKHGVTLQNTEGMCVKTAVKITHNSLNRIGSGNERRDFYSVHPLGGIDSWNYRHDCAIIMA